MSFLKKCFLLLMFVHPSVPVLASLFPNELRFTKDLPPSTCFIKIESIINQADGTNPAYRTDYCTGDVISSKFILLAAHCYRRSFPDGRVLQRRVKQSVYCPFSNRWYAAKTNAIIHPNYHNQQDENDVAVLSIKKGTFGVPSADFPEWSLETYFLVHAGRCIIAGFGETQSLDAPFNRALWVEHFISKEGIIYLNNRIASSGKDAFLESHLHIYGRTYAIPGDSGGPLFCQNIAGDWKRIGTLSKQRGIGDLPEKITSVELSWKGRQFINRYRGETISYSFRLQSRLSFENSKIIRENLLQELKFQTLLEQWDSTWVFNEEGLLAAIHTPDALDDKLVPLWTQLSKQIKDHLGWKDFL